MFQEGILRENVRIDGNTIHIDSIILQNFGVYSCFASLLNTTAGVADAALINKSGKQTRSNYLRAQASRVMNRVGVCVYSCHQIFFVIERTKDLIYLKFVVTDFFQKIISLSAGENSGDLA